jgi:uncharacterized Tic20 family protein
MSPYGVSDTYALTTTSPSGPTENERISAAIAHAGTLVSWFLAPLVVYFLERDRSEFASRNAMQALLWSGFGTLVSAATCGVAIPVFMAFHVYAAMKAWNGESYEYPLVGAIARRMSQRA